jgi:hypothetical protein
MLSDAMMSVLAWFLQREFFIYIRPYVGDDGLLWRVTAEKIGRQLIYVVEEDADVNEAVKKVYREVRKKMGIGKTRKRARRRL